MRVEGPYRNAQRAEDAFVERIVELTTARDRLAPHFSSLPSALRSELHELEAAVERHRGDESHGAMKSTLREYQEAIGAAQLLAEPMARARARRLRAAVAALVTVVLGATWGVLHVSELRAEEEANCRRSWRCTGDGRCAADPDGFCVASRNEDCEYARACRVHGRCTARGGACVVDSDTQCLNSEICYKHGQCTWDGENECRPRSQGDCEASTRCIEAGHCLYSSRRNGDCLPSTDAACAKTYECDHAGLCSFDAGCAAKANKDCEQSRGCVDHGRCTVEGRVCRAVSDADCAKSKDCTQNGACKSHGGYCVNPEWF